MIHATAKIHSTAIVEPHANVGQGSSVWHFCHLRNGATLADRVSVGRDVYVDSEVKIGRGTRVQNGVSLYNGIHVGDWCFIGPHAVFTNDMHPRAGKSDWTLVDTYLENGASIGAGAIIRCGVRIGTFAMVGAGAIVTKDVPSFILAFGLPAEPVARICACGDTQMALDSEITSSGLVRDCCRKNLIPEVLAAAEASAQAI
jgi:acetyltransferase-like isoleucine patch superfamily enzyme